MGQFQLLAQRRFLPFFATQFLGAFNDNLFKNALIILIAYKSLTVLGMNSEQVVAAGTGLFILPFFLFSATAGQLADKVSKATLMRWVKFAEIFIMGVGALGFISSHVPMLLFVLFLMGLQSAFFGPAKYAILPELLAEQEMVGGNALVEMATFLAVLLGTITGGVLIAQSSGPPIVSLTVIVIALLGWFASSFIIRTPQVNPQLAIDLNPITPTLQTYRVTRQNLPVFRSILGISWFWFLGASFLTILPNYCKQTLHADESVVTFFLALFCVGIAAGSMACERLSRRHLELGLVPVGSIGMTLFALDLFFGGAPSMPASADRLLTLSEVLRNPAIWRISADLVLIAVFSGFYTVPLYTMIQTRSDPAVRARVIAGNNILNAFFMVGSALMLLGLAAANVPQVFVFLILGVLNLIVAAYIYTVVPEFLFRFACWILASALYRLRVIDGEQIPEKGAAVLVANHVSFIDWLLVASISPRPVRFVMYHKYHRSLFLRPLFRDAKVIPIAPAHEDEQLLNSAFDRIAEELAAGELVCIFPEGKLTRDGQLNPFKTGIERILERSPVPVIPIAIVGMWGSLFSKKDRPRFHNPLRWLWSRVRLVVGNPVAPEQASATSLQTEVAKLGGF